MASYPTPHINAIPEDFAKTVLMPGDPLRAKFIAENYLDGARLGYAIACGHTDVTLPVIAKYCDSFCIGGTTFASNS